MFCMGVLPSRADRVFLLCHDPATYAISTLWLRDALAMLWQSAQALLVLMCVADLPVALVPLWHDEQVAVMLAWLKVAGVQPLTWWQLLPWALVGLSPAVLPSATEPL